jgi:hypothetical protein
VFVDFVQTHVAADTSVEIAVSEDCAEVARDAGDLHTLVSAARKMVLQRTLSVWFGSVSIDAAMRGAQSKSPGDLLQHL